MIHDDERRTLIDWSDSLPIETCKIVISKKEAVLGEHYHKKKTERFMLIRGKATLEFDDGTVLHMLPYIAINVLPMQRHKFTVEKDSILICLVDKTYDPDDDYKD